jgi:hypothetical protein
LTSGIARELAEHGYDLVVAAEVHRRMAEPGSAEPPDES